LILDNEYIIELNYVSKKFNHFNLRYCLCLIILISIFYFKIILVTIIIETKESTVKNYKINK